ncbi:hypothetical protein RRG08_059481 [Elysia crispata]|uniref:Uncharacterized protein n=1 Tax=Elysia crispata TaxID=231223 RepID=A0AAE1DT98_9GAST|nr:hypothetical protein RRG08_059481 [Elysia crispata]
MFAASEAYALVLCPVTVEKAHPYLQLWYVSPVDEPNVQESRKDRKKWIPPHPSLFGEHYISFTSLVDISLPPASFSFRTKHCFLDIHWQRCPTSPRKIAVIFN